MAERAEIILEGSNRTGPAFAGVQKGLENLDRAAAGVRASFGAFAGFASVALFAGWAKSAIDTADALGKMSERLGLSTEQLSAYQYAAKLSGSSLEELEKGLTKLSGTIAENGKALEVFKIATGITITAADGLDGALGKIADGFSKMRDGQVKNALAADLLGERLGTRLISLLNGGTEGLAKFYEEARKAGLLVSGETSRQAQEFNDNLDRLTASAEALGKSVANNMLPALGQVAQKMADASREGGILWGLVRGLAESGKIVLQLGADPSAIEAQKRYVQDLRGEIILLQRSLKEADSGGEGLLDRLISGSVEDRRRKLAELQISVRDAERALANLQRPPSAEARAAQADPYETQRKREEAAKAAAESSKKAAAARQKQQEDEIAFGKSISDQELRELERKADGVQRVRDEINEKKIEALQLGPTIAERDPTAGFRRVQELLADTKTGRADANNQDLGDLNDALVRGTITAKQYDEAFAGIEERYKELAGANGGNFVRDLDAQAEAFQRLEAAVKGWGNAFNEELVQGLKRGRFEVSTLVDMLATDIARLVLYRNITQPIFTGINNFLGTNGGTPSPAGGPFAFAFGKKGAADGGQGYPGSILRVGERGPETLFFGPNARGSIIPDGSGSRPNVSITIAPTIAPGASATEVFAAVRLSSQLAQSEIARTLRTGAA